MKKGDTILLDIGEKCYLYVERRMTDSIAVAKIVTEAPDGVNVTFEKPDKDTEYPIEKWVKFTAPASTYYTFEAQYDAKLKDAVTIEYYLLMTGKMLTITAPNKDVGEDVLSSVNAAEPESSKRSHYIVAGETVLIKLFVKEANQEDYKKAFTGDTKSFDVTVKVTPAEAIAELTDGSIVKPETVAVISYKIPEGYNQYTIKVEGKDAKIDNVRDSEGNILGTVENGDSFTFKVNEDKTTSLSDKDKGITVKAGDTIYIQVRNENEKEEATINVTTKSGTNTITTETKQLELVNGYEEWYTFTAEKTGFYEVEADVIQEHDKKNAHELKVYEAIEVFGGDKNAIRTLYSLKSGQTLILHVMAIGTYDEDVITKASLSITPVEVTPLKLGEEAATEVTLNSKDEVKYYSFTASDTTDTYTVKWTPANDEQGAVTVSTGTAIDSLTDNKFTIGRNTITTYIAVKQNSFLSATGKLSITAGKSVETLRVGKAVDFSVAKGETKEYSFIPGSNPFGYVVEVTNKMPVEIKTDYPIEAEVADVYNARTIKAGKTGRFDLSDTEDKYTIRIRATEAGVDATIKVSAYEPIELAGDKTEADVTEAGTVWYKYEIPASGRYVLATEFDKANKAAPSVAWTAKYVGSSYSSSRVYDADYFKKGTILYAKVTNSSIGEASKVTINKPTLLAPTKTLELNKEEKVELAKGQTAEYCMFTAPEDGNYTVKAAFNSGIEKMGYLNSNGGSNNPIKLDKDQAIFVKVISNTTLKVELAVIDKIDGEKDITIKSREHAYYEFTAYKDGVYEFKSASELSVLNLVDAACFGPSTIKNYKAAQLKAGQKVTLDVTWTSADTKPEDTFKLSASELTPSKSVADKDTLEVKNNSVEWYEYTTAQFGKYDFAVSKPDNAAKDVAAPQKSVYMYNSKKAEYEPITSEDLTEGRKILIAVANTGKADASYTFTDGYKAYDNVLDFEGSEERTITFKPETTGIYKFSVNALDGGNFKISGSEIAGVNAGSFADLTDGMETNILHKDETYTFTVKQESPEKSSVAYNIVLDTTIPVYEAASGVYTFNADRDPGTETYSDAIIEFNVGKTGDYIIEAKGTEPTDTSDWYTSVYKLKDNVVNSGSYVNVNEDILTDLATGERIYLQVYGAKAGCTLKLNGFADFNLGGGQKGKLDETDTGLHLYKLTIPETDTYELSRAVVEKTEEEAADTNFDLQKATVWYKIDNDNWREMYEDNPETVSDKTVYLKVSTGLEEPPKKSDTDTSVTKYGYDIRTAKYGDIKDAKGTIKKDETKYFKWVVPEDGEYTIVKEKGADDAPNVFTVQSKTNVDGSYSGDFSGFDKRELKEKDEYYFKITTTTTEESSNYGLTVSKFQPASLGEGKGTIEKDADNKFFEWTAASAGQYIIDYNGTAKVEIKKKLAEDKKFGSSNLASLTESMTVDTYGTYPNWLNIEKGDTLRFEVSYQQQDEDKACDYSIAVKKVPWKSLENGGKLEASGSFKIRGKYDYYWFDAKPDTDYFVEVTATQDKGTETEAKIQKVDGVKVQYYTYKDGNAWSNVGSKLPLTEGFVYFRVERKASGDVDSEKEVAYTLRLKTYGELGNGTGSVSKDETKYFEYTVKTAGDYIIEYDGVANVASYYVEREGTRISNNNQLENKTNEITLLYGLDELKKGDKLKFTITYVPQADDKACDYKITVKKLEDASTKLEVNKEVTDKEIGSIDDYYEFTATSGRYVLEFSGNVNVTSKSGESVNDSRIFLDFDNSSDKTKYFTVKKTGTEEKEKYSIIVKSYTPLTVGSKEYEFTAKTDKYAYYKLETEGFYAVEFSSENASWDSDNERTFKITKGNPQYFVVTKNNAEAEGVKYSISVKDDFTSLTEGKEVSGELEAGKNVYYKFTNNEDESRRYTVTASGTATLQYCNSNGGTWYSMGTTFTLGQGGVRYFRIKAGAAACDYKLTIKPSEEYKEAKLEGGKATISGSIAKDGVPVNLKFTVYETAVYKLTKKVNENTPEESYMTLDAYDENNKYSTFTVPERVTYVSNEEDKATTYDVTLEKVKPESLPATIEVKEAAVYKYYEFTAPQDGEYVVENIDNCELSNYYIHEIDTMKAEVQWKGTSYDEDKRLRLMQGETLGLYVKADPSGDSENPDKKYKLSISKANPYVRLALGKEYKVSAEKNDYVYFSYTVPETSDTDKKSELYYVYLNGLTNAYYSMNNWSDWYSCNSDRTYNLSEGQTLYIKVQKDAAEEKEYTIKVSLYDMLTLGAEHKASAEKNDYVYFRYTVPETVNPSNPYYVYLNGLTSVRYGTDKNSSNWNYYYGANPMTVSLSKGQTLYIRAQKNTAEEKEYTIEITDKEKETTTPTE